VRWIAEGSPTAAKTEGKLNLISHLQNPKPVHVFTRPVIRKRKESARNAFGIAKKKTKLV
jgi:hypothetical protein